MQSRRDIALSPGDAVRVHQKITEGGKVRIQVFEGTIIARKHGTEPGATFTVRRVSSDGIAVEKIYPLYSPMIDRIEVTKRTKMRRSRLYFLRDKTPRQIREKLRRTKMVSESTVSELEQEKGEEPKREEESEPNKGSEQEEKQNTAKKEEQEKPKNEQPDKTTTEQATSETPKQPSDQKPS